MTEEERQRTMELIREQQAQFTVEMQVVRERQAHTEQLIAMNAETLSEFIQTVTRSIEALVAAQARTDEQMKRTDERLKQTDERLNVLINVVERHISEGHGHGG